MSKSNSACEVVITGARGKLGQALQDAFSDGGWAVWAANRPPRKDGEETESSGAGRNLTLDLHSDASIAAAVEQLFRNSNMGPREIALVANASNREALKNDWQDCNRAQFHDIFDVDVIGHFLLARELREAALEHDCSLTVLFIGSIYGLGGVKTSIYPEGMAASPLQYSVAKSALHGLTRDLAARWGGDRIRVNCLAAGGIFAGQDQRFVDAYAQQTPTGRMMAAAEIAELAVALCAPASRAVNGQIICADGGWTAW